MRKIAGAAFYRPPRPLLHMTAVFSSINAHAGSVWLVSHHHPASEAAYNRDAYVGQQGGFVKGRPRLSRQRGGGIAGIGGIGGGGGGPAGAAPADGR